MAKECLSDSEVGAVFEMVELGLTRSEIAERVGVPQHRLFDRTVEQRRRGTLAHPRLAHLPHRQGKGGGRRVAVTPQEIALRAAEVRQRHFR